MRRDTIHSVRPAVCRWDRWDEDDLVDRVCDALDGAERVIRRLAEAADEDEAVSCEDVLVAETAVFLLAASNVASYAAIGPRIIRVATLLVPHARSRRVLRAICLEPAAAFEHAKAHICLKRLGFYDCDFDAMLDLAAAAQAADGRERAPHRMLEQEWLKQSWLYPEGMHRLRCGPHVAGSALNRPIDLLHGSRADVACFTHALMYMTDFNLFPRVLPRSRESLLAEAEGMLARCLEEEDYGLAAEVLVAWPLTGEGWSPAAAFTLRVLARAERRDGMAPVLYGMGLLCAVSLADRRLPPVRIPQRRGRTGALGSVLECADFGGARRLWQDELEELELEERESLAEFLLCLALQRESGRSGFAAMERLLEVGRGLELAGSPLATQAGEMMARVAQLDMCETGLLREESVYA